MGPGPIFISVDCGAFNLRFAAVQKGDSLVAVSAAGVKGGEEMERGGRASRKGLGPTNGRSSALAGETCTPPFRWPPCTTASQVVVWFLQERVVVLQQLFVYYLQNGGVKYGENRRRSFSTET